MKIIDELTDAEKNILNEISKLRNHLCKFLNNVEQTDLSDEIIDNICKDYKSFYSVMSYAMIHKDYLFRPSNPDKIPYTSNSDENVTIKHELENSGLKDDTKIVWNWVEDYLECSAFIDDTFTMFDLLELIGDVELKDYNECIK